ncbi:FAD binding domain-containing protein [Histoplasma capsulatum var. duboisii H88]|uniref:Delta(24)-sterol reductase n=1 Tax=Ajellomyces capsulatus (strain H88) TaxID=544711 RepID=F0UBR1_AJEC8|nr:FAD binding domain-containing protein [Histoplasma capsulatum var. duboisii H88]
MDAGYVVEDTFSKTVKVTVIRAGERWVPWLGIGAVVERAVMICYAAAAAAAAQVRRFHANRTPFRIYHGATNSTRALAFQRDRLVDTSALNRVLSVDERARTALVEPNVPMDALVAATLRHGLVPPVVMEFPGITVGGGFAGMGGESSSFRYGMFHEAVRWVEVVVGDGRVVGASASGAADGDGMAEDLFHGLAGSMGSLGITTLLELRLIEARAFVEVSYRPVSGVHEAVETVRSQAARSLGEVDYVDAILFSAEMGVVVSGRLTDAITAPDGRIQRFSRARDPWFYTHAQERVSQSSPSDPAVPIIETVPLTDYLFRYDRGAFWTGYYAFKYFRVPFTALTRWLLDSFLHTRVMYHALHRSGFAQKYIIQDLALPHGAAAEEFLDFVQRESGVGDRVGGCFPLWLCPLRLRRRGRGATNFGSMHPRCVHSQASHPPPPSSLSDEAPQPDDMLLNVGLWCPGPPTADAFVNVNRAIEQKVSALRGTKWLYAHTYYTEEEFWDIYDRQWYEGLREKYGASYLPDVYERVRVGVGVEEDGARNAREGWRGVLGRVTGWVWGIWPLAGVYGVMSTMVGGRGYLVEGERRGGKVAVAIVAAHLGSARVFASHQMWQQNSGFWDIQKFNDYASGSHAADSECGGASERMVVSEMQGLFFGDRSP